SAAKSKTFIFNMRNKPDRRDRHQILPQKQRKSDFDATSSEANGGISTLDNPKSQSFKELTFFDCTKPCLILTQTTSY
ncbi:hypothetical protein PFISCL1PPCAC_23358, partial [Pristionchus fissidentatus]